MSMSNKIPEAELPAALRQPSQDLVPGTKHYHDRRVENLKAYVPMAVSLDALPPYLSNRNHPNTAFVPPVLFFGFEISGNNQYWEAIYPNLGGVTQQIVYGLDGNTVEIAVIGNNVEPFPPCTQEGIDKTIKALGHPPKVYVSIEYPWWGRRLHYNYSW